jgi:hypothetical protein
MRLLQICRVNFVVFGDSSVDAESHRLGLSGQMRDAKWSPPTLNSRSGNIHNIAHGVSFPLLSKTDCRSLDTDCAGWFQKSAAWLLGERFSGEKTPFRLEIGNLLDRADSHL